ncbi:MAG: 3-methyl-2-oxobutanoate dehydrogenase subunit VorB [Bacillota bacterium]|nr:3-methyl-2-oxobutanoate dehydrogenase subunit VorB [Bacillota bacterium]
MGERELTKGNEAMAEAAIRAGCRYFFGYPITPQSELLEYMAKHLEEHGGVFLQAESEVSAINMVYGAAGAGARVMTATSSPGFSLMQEGLSYLAGAELPAVVVDVVRGGPGLGGLQPAQSDYFQATKGGGHGDYRLIVLAPSSPQEAADLVYEAFDLADRYRNVVLILADSILAQAMEPVELPPARSLESLPPKPWATVGRGAGRREPNVVHSLYLAPEDLWAHNQRLQAKYRRIEAEETRWEEREAEDADWLVVAYGSMARIALAAIRQLRRQGLRVGLFRPITLWPFPSRALARRAASVRGILAMEMSAGQMVEDVRLAVEGAVPVRFFGKTGGVVPEVEEATEAVRRMAAEAAPHPVRPGR